ncbi:MAG: phage tail protein I [Pseudomonadota bacterium]|nr:phage tail protein I [Pseudomonadota bacterium]
MNKPVPSLLPPNASRAERALEAAICEPIAAIPAPQRTLWNPDTCPASLLPWLAWAMSVDTWKPWWPEHIKRAILRSAIAIQRRKGTVDSVRQLIGAFGGRMMLTEWWQQTPAGTPHTFALVLSVAGLDRVENTAEFVEDIIREVRRVKPVRSHFTFTQGVDTTGSMGLAAITRPVLYRRLHLETAA